MYKAIKKINGVEISLNVYEPNDIVQVCIAGEPMWYGNVRRTIPELNATHPLYAGDPRPEKCLGWYIVDPVRGGTARCIHTNEMTLAGKP